MFELTLMILLEVSGALDRKRVILEAKWKRGWVAMLVCIFSEDVEKKQKESRGFDKPGNSPP